MFKLFRILPLLLVMLWALPSIADERFSTFENMPEDHLYFYKATVTDVYDADTVTVDIDLGFHITMNNQKLRLYGIDAWEVRGAERVKGLLARNLLSDRILGKEIIIRTHKDNKGNDGKGKYGRWLAELFDPETNENLNLWLVTDNHAEINFYD